MTTPGPDSAAADDDAGGTEPPLTAPLTDSHCHLDRLDARQGAAAVLAEAAAVGVHRLVAVAQEAQSMDAVLELARRWPGQVLPGVGIHPCTVTEHGAAALEPALERLEALAPQAAVIGESGLDHQWAADAAQQAEQLRFLERHFEVAARHRKPVNLHARRCLRQTMEQAIAFHRDTGLNAQLHWFTHSRKLVRIANDAGIYMSAGPTIIHDEPSAEVACEIDLDLLLLESDAPVAIRRIPGHPKRVRQVAEKLARLRGVSLQELATRLEANLHRYLGRAPDAAALD